MSQFVQIRDECLKRGRLFEDGDFPAVAQSITKVTDDVAPSDWLWKRPTEICKKPKFIIDGASRFDFVQGELGDCWFIAAAAVLATKKTLLNKVVPDGQAFNKNYAGVFRFNFWRFGSWHEVVIDDRLPVTVDCKLRFAHNRTAPNEFWSALLEKAYAKLHGSYTAVAAGHIRDALVDFTGGISEDFNLRQEDRLPPDLFHIINKSFAAGSLMGCGIWGDRDAMQEEKMWNGLYKGHAYSITAILQTRISGWPVKLLRLRNPWGEKEWTGAWCDGSDEWNSMDDEGRQKVGLKIEDDGEFWMSYGDWLKNFHALDIVHIVADPFARAQHSKSTQMWNETVHHGEWIKGISAGGCSLFSIDTDKYYTNPQYHVSLTSPDRDDVSHECTCVVSLLQKHYRKRKNNPHEKKLIIGFDVHQVKDGRTELLTPDTIFTKAVLKKKFRARTTHREVSCRLTLDPGLYCIIPNTLRSNQSGEFLLRIYTFDKITSGTMEDMAATGNDDLAPDVRPMGAISSDLYRQYSGDDMTIDSRDLRDLLNELTSKEFGHPTAFGIEACRSLIGLFDQEQCGVLDFEDTNKLWDELLFWKKAFSKYDRDKTGSIETYELRKIFKDMGIALSLSAVSTLAVRYGGKDMALFYEDFALCVAKSLSLNVAFNTYSKDSPGEARLNLEEWMRTMLFL